MERDLGRPVLLWSAALVITSAHDIREGRAKTCHILVSSLAPKFTYVQYWRGVKNAIDTLFPQPSIALFCVRLRGWVALATPRAPRAGTNLACGLACELQAVLLAPALAREAELLRGVIERGAARTQGPRNLATPFQVIKDFLSRTKTAG